MGDGQLVADRDRDPCKHHQWLVAMAVIFGGIGFVALLTALIADRLIRRET
jgi:hypothetical protein